MPWLGSDIDKFVPSVDTNIGLEDTNIGLEDTNIGFGVGVVAGMGVPIPSAAF